MQPQTPRSSITPVPVLWAGFALMAAAALSLGYQAYSRVPGPAAARESLPEALLDLGTLASAPTLATSTAPFAAASRALPAPTGAWSSRSHAPAPAGDPGASADAPAHDHPPDPTGDARADPLRVASRPSPDAAAPASPSASAIDTDETTIARLEPPASSIVVAPELRRSAPEETAAPRIGDEVVPVAKLEQALVRGDVSRPEVVLSFDGGSGASAAPRILEILRREGVRTTFFLTGDFIRNYPDLVRQIVAQGHEVGNHTDHHAHLTTWEENRRHDTRPGVDRSVFLGRLQGAHVAFRQVVGREPAPFWRAPYGEVNGQLRRWAAGLGYRHVGWTPGLDSLDWVSDPESPQYRTSEQFLALLARRARSAAHGLNGAIILMHLHSERPEAERFDRGLAQLIRWLRASGYGLVPVSRMAPASGPGAPSQRPANDRAMGGR